MTAIAYKFKPCGVDDIAAKYASRGRVTKSAPSFCRRSAKQVISDFVARLRINGTCWEWIGGKTSKGYGAFTFWNRTVRASQFAFAIKTGRAATKGVLHTCDNPICCRPSHLFEGDDLANMQDRHRKGGYETALKGEDHPRAKLTEEQVRDIRAFLKAGIKQRPIAIQYGVSRKAIFLIKNRVNWKHI